MVDIIKAIESLKPAARWTLVGYSYENLDWLDEVQAKPTEAEINAEITRLQAEYDAKQYQRDRADKYPSIQEQLDMQYWDSVNGTTTWADAIAAVKQEFPKP
jgi:hypothetical protein